MYVVLRSNSRSNARQASTLPTELPDGYLFTHSPSDGCLCCFQFTDAIDKAAVNTHTRVSGQRLVFSRYLINSGGMQISLFLGRCSNTSMHGVIFKSERYFFKHFSLISAQGHYILSRLVSVDPINQCFSTYGLRPLWGSNDPFTGIA